MHVPTDAGPDTRRAIQEILDELRSLKNKMGFSSRDFVTPAEIDDLRKEISRATQRPQTLDFEDVMRGAGTAHSLGFVPDTGPYAPMDANFDRAGTANTLGPNSLTGGNAGDLRVLHEDGRWKYIADGLIHSVPGAIGGAAKSQRLVEVSASLAVDNALKADTIHCREIYVRHIPYCVLRRSSNQTLTTGANTAILFDTEDTDTDGLHDLVTNTSRLTISRTGLWLVGAALRFAGNATSFRRTTIVRNSTDVLSSMNMETVTAVVQDIALPVVLRRLTAGDFLELFAVQNSGGNLDVQATNFLSPYLWAYWMAM